MKLLKFRIKNYKSIVDTGECNLEQDITILAGKNEAGKTAILEALEDFNVGSEIRKSAVPLFSKDKLPEITLTFSASEKELTSVLNDIGLSGFGEDTELILTKIHPGNSYSVPDETFNKIGIDKIKTSETNEDVITSKHGEISKFLAAYHPSVQQLLPALDLQNLDSFRQGLTQLIEAPKTEISDEDVKTRVNSSAQDILAQIDAPTIDSVRGEITTALTSLIPNFILFSSFDDVFPSVISTEEAKTNQLIQDLDIISDLSLETLVSGQPAEKMKHLRLLNQRIKEEYQEYWTQDITHLQVNYDSGNLNFFIEEDGEFYPPEVRSKGKQWHLAFYIRVSARSAEEKGNIILIDEPGLFLHATAQKDILHKLEDSSKNSQIVFSTHSPYLLEQEDFIRIRLVQRGVIPNVIEENEIEQQAENKSSYDELTEYYDEKTHKENKTKYYTIKNKELNDDKQNKLRNILIRLGYNIGTSVEDKLHKVADKETLTPILTAIGLELTSGIVSVDKEKNTVCEGQSDVFYLQAFKKLSASTKTNFVFGGGAGNMPIVGTILSGWGCKVLYLYDNDKGKKDGEKNLKKNWLISTEHIVSVVTGAAGSIEDVFSEDDFKKYVLEDNEANLEGSNSEYMKKEKKDKVMHSKNFYRLCDEGKVSLDKVTEGRINKLMQTLEEKYTSAF